MFSSQSSQVSSAANYIEDMFSTYLYTGNGGSQTITNGIDLAGKGGLVWIKSRGLSGNNTLIDSVRGISKFLYTNDISAQANDPGTITSFNSNGFTQNNSYGDLNSSGRTYVSWTFREQPKFFDVVTYTGNGGVNSIAHNLGSTPGCIIIKATNGTTPWAVYHRSTVTPNNYYLLLNTTDAAANVGAAWCIPTNTEFTVQNTSYANASGVSFVAYIFAHNAGGFGLTGTDNVISCGSFTTDGTGAAGNITLGYEAQWLLIKRSDGVGGWNIIDTMRGSSLTSYNYLSPNTSGVESSSTSAGQGIFPTATGFFVGTNFPAASATYIYIAIRRPMKVPTLGTSVYNAIARTGTGATANVTGVGFSPDLVFAQRRAGGDEAEWFDRLRGPTKFLWSPTTDAEQTDSLSLTSFDMDGFSLGADTSWGKINFSGRTYINWALRRALGFFDEVCYTGDGTLSRNISHNLAAVPQLVITKPRSGTGDWKVYDTPSGGSITLLNSSNGFITSNLTGGYVSSTSATLISVNPWSSSVSAVNASGTTYVAYLFATCLGVSKVGSYTGTGALQTVACGFTSGARFVLIKRTDSTGDWYVWDSVRGISSGNDPYLLLNTAGAEVTTTNYVDTDTTGFKVTAAAPAGINASGGTYIFLAIA